MTKYFNFPCQTEMVWMFKNICKNIKPYKFSNAKNIELLVYFYKKILRTWKMLKFQKPKNIGSLTWILLVLIKKKECIHHASFPQTWRSSDQSRSCYRGRQNEGYNPTQVGPWWRKGCAVTTGQFGFVRWRSSLAWHESQKHGVWAGQRLQHQVLYPLQQSQDHNFLRR